MIALAGLGTIDGNPREPHGEWTLEDFQARILDIIPTQAMTRCLALAADILATHSPAPTEAGEGITVPLLDPVYAEDHPLLAPIIAKRARAAGDLSEAFSGQRGYDFDRGLLCAFEAVNGALQKLTAAALSCTQGGAEG